MAKAINESDFGQLDNVVGFIKLLDSDQAKRLIDAWGLEASAATNQLSLLTRILSRISPEKLADAIGKIDWVELITCSPLELASLYPMGLSLMNLSVQRETTEITNIACVREHLQKHLPALLTETDDFLNSNMAGTFGEYSHALYVWASFLNGCAGIDVCFAGTVATAVVDKFASSFQVAPANYIRVARFVRALNRIEQTLAQRFLETDKVIPKIIHSIKQLDQQQAEPLVQLIEALYASAPDSWLRIARICTREISEHVIDLDSIYDQIDAVQEPGRV